MNANAVTTTINDTWTPLHLASSLGHIEVAKILIKVGKADVNNLLEKYGTPLHCAARSGRAQIVSYLLMSKASVEYYI